MNWQGKKVVVLGLGESGLSATRLLVPRGVEVTVMDEFDNAQVRARASQAEALGARVLVGSAALAPFSGVDLAVLSPGIDPRKPLVGNFMRMGVPVWSELELAYRFCECPVVAITGTNGKTTTTELTHAVFEAAGKRSCAAGNIGYALSDAVQRSHEMDVMVVEASSFQLERVIEFKPRIAAFLNLTPDHMDRYPDMYEYRAAKMRIFLNQDSSDYGIVHASLLPVKIPSKMIAFSARGHAADYTYEGGDICWKGRCVLPFHKTRLRGLHNAENAMVAMAAGHIYGLDERLIIEALVEYRPAAHRCELVAEVGGVEYINDSKATNPDAVEVALISQTRPVVLIAGGKNKGLSFDSLSATINSKTKGVVLIGESAPLMREAWGDERCVMAKDMAEAVRLASGMAAPGDTVLLSPACASFDMFKDYADRGSQFRKLVLDMARSRIMLQKNKNTDTKGKP